MYLCTGGSLTLSVSQDVTFNYLWSNGATGHQTSINAPGTYWVEVTSPCDTATDTVQVALQNPAVFSLGPDTTLCAGTPLTLGTVPPDGVSVLWSTGATTATLSPTASGTYTCRWTNACGPVYDTIVVNFLTAPTSPLPPTAAFCDGSTLTLNGTSTTGTTYLWDDGSTNPQRVINQEGWYTLTLTNLCGQTVDSIYARADTALLPVNLGPDTIFCAGTVVLDPGPNPHVSYLWSTGATAPTLAVSSTGTYWVRVENTCETRYDTIQVLVTGPPALVLGTQVAFCQGTILTLNAQNPGCSYQWSTGATSQTLAVTTGGKYWVTISNDCGQLTDTVDVVVENPLTLNLGADTVACPGDSITLNAFATGAYYLWSTGATGPQITVNQTGNYWVEIWNTCGSRKDTISVIILTEPVFQLPVDTFICNTGGSKVLQVPQWPHHAISWSDGSTQPSFTATQPGTYWVTLTNLCSSYSDTIVLSGEDPLVIDLGPDDTLCQGSVFPVQSGISDRPVQWSDGSVGPTLFVTQPGTYWAVAENSCGPASDTVTFHFQAAPDFPRTDTVVCLNDSAQFNIPHFEGSFVWFDGNTNPERSFWKAGIYTAELTNVCGTFLKEFQVRKTNCDCDVYLADAFTPNGDGINDRYVPGLTCEIRSFEMRIYDRWGNQVFAGFNTDETWDGTFKGQPADQGIYTYRLFYIWNVYGEFQMRERTGRIALIR
jgi:gliding motility-associated-like protein